VSANTRSPLWRGREVPGGEGTVHRLTQDSVPINDPPHQAATSTIPEQQKYKIRTNEALKKIPVGAKFSASVQTGNGAHPASCTIGTGYFPGVKRSGRGVDHPPHLVKVHVNVTCNRPQIAQRGSRGIALLTRDLGAIREWVVSTTHRPIYPQERLGTDCTEGWAGPRALLDRCEKLHPHRDFFIALYCSVSCTLFWYSTKDCVPWIFPL
jgi:hypothetical protein